jgi:hypothetical protein
MIFSLNNVKVISISMFDFKYEFLLYLWNYWNTQKHVYLGTIEKDYDVVVSAYQNHIYAYIQIQ